MPLGQKLYEESGNITGFKITKVHPIDGTTMELSFMSDIKGFGKFPGGKGIGSGILTQYPHGVGDASFQGNIMMKEEGGGVDQIFWWTHQKTKVDESGNSKGLGIISFYMNSQELSWINRLIVADEVEVDFAKQQFKIVGYEWI